MVLQNSRSDVKNKANYNNGNLMKNYKSLNELIPLGVVMPWLRNKFIGKLSGFERRRLEATSQANAFIKDIIDKKLGSRSSETSLEPALIDRILDLVRNGDLSYDDVMGEFSNIIFAASDTTSVTVNNVLSLLAMFPKVQDKVFEELAEVFPSVGGSELSHGDVEKLVYLDQVLQETLRLIPAVPLLIRQTSQEIRLSNGFQIPEGVTLMIDIFHTHQNTDVWGPKAGEFNPDNFLAVNKRNRHPYGYLPFSKGKKTCLGYKLSLISVKLALAKILRNYKLSTSFLYQDLEFVDNTTIKLAKQPKLKIERRT
ncbi:probable cytochrome P450 313a5 isoform X2 [Drosophila takahashii]|uniref:probable cytochrome P450 313a5 isoform X2 n=1 Tax=Drosophila takahashii TaxID=29030 RepID=UPI003898FA3D